MHLVPRVSGYIINLVFYTSYVALKPVEIIKMGINGRFRFEFVQLLLRYILIFFEYK